jgi:uncharacterized protein (DUF1684 family)
VEQSTRPSPATLGSGDALALLDWKRRVFALYEEIRAMRDPERAWRRWTRTRDELFRTHAQSPIPADRRESFGGCRYYDYDPEAHVVAEVIPATPEAREIVTSTASRYRFFRFARALFELGGRELELELYWLDGYGGGLFLPFGDETSGETTYPAGRYLLDTVKGADLGGAGSRIVLDFNFAYNPSCAYDPRWTCPLAPTGNWLPVGIAAGEQTP